MNKNNANCIDRKRLIFTEMRLCYYHMLKTHLKTPFIKSMTKAEVYTGIHPHKLTRKRKTGKPVLSFFKAHIGRNSAGPC